MLKEPEFINIINKYRLNNIQMLQVNNSITVTIDNRIQFKYEWKKSRVVMIFLEDQLHYSINTYRDLKYILDLIQIYPDTYDMKIRDYAQNNLMKI